MNRALASPAAQAGGFRKTGGDPPDARRQQPVGAAEDGILPRGSGSASPNEAAASIVGTDG